MSHTAVQALQGSAPAQVSCDGGHQLPSYSGPPVGIITCSYEGTYISGKHPQGSTKSCILNRYREGIGMFLLGIRETSLYTLRGYFSTVSHWSKTVEMSGEA